MRYKHAIKKKKSELWDVNSKLRGGRHLKFERKKEKIVVLQKYCFIPWRNQASIERAIIIPFIWILLKNLVYRWSVMYIWVFMLHFMLFSTEFFCHAMSVTLMVFCLWIMGFPINESWKTNWNNWGIIVPDNTLILLFSFQS